jgi:hypothetical protein
MTDEPTVDPLVPWLDRTIERLEETTTDSEMRAVLQEACDELDDVPEQPEMRKIISLNLRQASAMLTREQASDALIPNLQRMRDDLAKAPPEAGKPGCAAPSTTAIVLLAVPVASFLVIRLVH